MSFFNKAAMDQAMDAFAQSVSQVSKSGGNRSTGSASRGTGSGPAKHSTTSHTGKSLTPWQPEQQEQTGGFSNSIQAVTPGQQTMSAQQDAQMQRQQAEQAAAMRAQQEQQEQALRAQQEQQRQARENYDRYMAEAQRLSQEREANTQIYADGIYMGEDKKAAAAYDRRISEARQKADAELAKLQPVSSGKRDRLLDEYNSALEEERNLAGYAVDDMSRHYAEDAGQNRKKIESELKAENRRLGNNVYAGLADEAQARDVFEGFQGERMSGYGDFLGTVAEWADHKINPDERGKLGDWGAAVFENSGRVGEQAQADWNDSISNMSETGKFLMGVGKTFANTTEDALVNFMIPGSGLYLASARAGGAGARTQSQRENNDIDARMTKLALDAGLEFLTERLVGGAEAAYDKSVFAKMLESKIPAMASPAMKTLLNTEGLEEGLNYGLGLLGDRILDLDKEGKWNWGEFWENVAVGYFMGVVFNGVSGGVEYNAKKISNVVDESIEAAQSGKSLEEITRTALANTSDQFKIQPGKQRPDSDSIMMGSDTGMNPGAPEAEMQTGTEADRLASLAAAVQEQQNRNAAVQENAEPVSIPENTNAAELTRGSGKVSFDGAVVDGVEYAPVDTANLTLAQRRQINAMEAVAGATGVNVVFFQSKVNDEGQYVGANGFYKDGTVYLDVNAGLESAMADGSTVGEVAIVRTASHELTHFIQDFNAAEYDSIRNYVLETLVEKTGAEDVEALVRQKMARDASGQLTWDEAVDEVIADGCEMMLKDSSAIERLAAEKPTLAARIRDWIHNWVANIRAAFEGIGATHKEARILMENAEKLQNMWDAALENAARNNTAEGSTRGETQYSAREEYAPLINGENIEENAVNKFGTTEDVNVAGYVLPDGRMLDFSGAHWLEDSDADEIAEWRKRNNFRQVDHEDIYEAFGDPWLENSAEKFIRRGNIRMAPEAPGVEIDARIEPTAEQYNAIRNLVRETGDRNFFAVDLMKGGKGRGEKLTYEGGVNADRVINDIKHFYRTGEIRTQSDLAKFRYSDRERVDPQNASEEAFVEEQGQPGKKVPAARFSLRSMRHDVQEGKMFDDLARYTDMNETEIENLRSGLNHLMDFMSLNRDILDMNETYGKEDRPFKPYKPNSDPLYTISLDFSTLCRKRLMTQYVIEKLQTELTDSETGKRGRALSAEEQLAVRDLMKEYAQQDKALKVACAMCYVEAARLKAPKQITKFIRDPESAMLRYFALKNKDFNNSVKEAQADFKEQRGYDRNAAKKDMKPADVRALNNLSSKLRNAYGDSAHPASAEELEAIRIAKTLPNETYLTAANLARLAEGKKTRAIYDAYTATIRTATRSKSLEADIPYYYGDSRGEVSDEFIQHVNAENGMRFSSWSDFQIQHMLDMMTAVIELGSRNTAMHGYTKFLEQVRIFGKTGMMFNMSGVPQGTGLKADGSLDFSPTESVLVKSEDGSEYDAIRARDEFPETAGLQCIGISPEHIKALMDSDIIDYIIPYHTSGLNASLRRMAQISNWDDFTSFQNAAEDKSIHFDPAIHDKETWHKEPVFSEFFNAAKDPANGFQEGEPGIVTMRRSADLYKQMCAERGLKPKFSWGNSKINADFSNDPNYWKLLIDRKMINQKTGALIEQKPVRPIFDFDLIESMAQNEVDSYDPTLQDRALAYVRDHLGELPKRISDLKKSGAVKKAVANSKKVDDLARSFDELQAGVVAAAAQPVRAQLRENGTGRLPPRNRPQSSTYDPQNPFGIGTPAETPRNAPQPSGGTETPAASDVFNVGGLTGQKQSPREKLSQYFTNTLTESGRAEGLDPITYQPTSEAESLTNAAMALAEDKQAMLDNLMNSAAWTGEMVDAAWMIENELYKDFVRSGDTDALNAWKRIEAHKISETAKGLQAVAKQSRPGAAAVLNAVQAQIDSLRAQNAEARKAGRTKDVISEEVLQKAEVKGNEFARRMAELEAGIDDDTAAGMTEAQAKEARKSAYLDLIGEINRFRNTGFISDAALGKNAGKAAGKTNTLFRRMLANQDMDYIQRYAACAAAGMADDAAYAGKQDTLKRLNTFQKLAQLTGTGTWGRNLIGNASFGLVDVLSADNPVTLLADALVGRKTGQRSSGIETGVLNRAARQESLKALQRSILEVAGNIDLATDTDQTKYDMSRTRTYDPKGNTAERVLSRWEQWNGYMLNSSDAGFKGMAEGSAREAIMRANGWTEDSMTPKQRQELDETVRQIAEYRTFQNEGATAKLANETRDLFNRFGGRIRERVTGKGWEKGQFGLGTALMPYTKVPANIGVKALEFSPAGAAKGLAEMVRVLSDPKATMAQQNQAVTDFGRGVTGTMLIGVLASAMKNAPFFRDWEDEDDKDVKAQNKAEGKSGIQLNLDMMLRSLNGEKGTEWKNGDRCVDISSMEPVNQLLTTASLIADGEDFGKAVLQSAKENIMDIPSLQTLSNIENTIRYTDTPDDLGATLATTAASTAGSVAGGFIPAPVRHLAAVTDEYARDTSGNNAAERAWNQIVSGIPGARQSLPVKTDAFGNEVKAGDAGTRILNQYGAFKYSQINQSDVSREMERLREETGEVLVPSRNGPKNLTFGTGKDKETVKLTAKENTAYRNAEGQVYEDAVQNLMRSAAYRVSDDETKAAMIGELESYAKDAAKADYADRNRLDYDSNYAAVRDLDNPALYLGTRTGFNAAMRNENWDAADALIEAAGRMSKKDQAYLREHTDSYGKYADFAEEGVGARSVNRYETELDALVEKEGRKSENGYDIFRVVAGGDFTPEEADAFMNRQKSDGSYYAGKGRHAVYQAVREAGYTPDIALQFWDMLDENQNGTLTKKELRNAAGAFPEPYLSQIRSSIQENGF